MTITEKHFQTIIRFGGLALAICLLGNLYLVLRFREVYRDRIKAETEFQQVMIQVQRAMPQQQVFENVIRGFLPRATNDTKVAEILLRYQIIGGAPGAATNPPAGGNP